MDDKIFRKREISFNAAQRLGLAAGLVFHNVQPPTAANRIAYDEVKN